MKDSQLLQRVYALYDLYHRGKIPTLSEHEVHPDVPVESRERYLYFTLPVCLNFQRNSPAMWRSAYATWHDPETNYLFFPEKTAIESYEKVQADLRKHKLSLQPNKHTEIWTKVSRGLHELYDNDPRKLLAACKNDVVAVRQLLQVDQKEHFPYLRGGKMSNYWLYILSQYTDVTFKNMQEISIIPDTHVQQCSLQLGLVDEVKSPEAVAEAWKKLLEGSRLTPVQMHPVLWNWSRNNFLPAV